MPVLLVEEGLEKVASNHLCRLDRRVLEEAEPQDRRGEEIPEQPNKLSSEA